MSGQHPPPVMEWQVRQNRSLHEFVLVVTLTVVSKPRIDPEQRLTLTKSAPNFWRAELRYGFIEHPGVPAALAESKALGCEIDIGDAPTMSSTKRSCRARMGAACRICRRRCSP